MFLVFITQLISGLTSGVLLTLVAIGIALTFGLLKVVNLSHAAIYTLGGYLGLTVFHLCEKYNVPGGFWFALIAAGIGTGIVGSVMERFIISKVYEQPVLGFLVTFALLMGIAQVVRIIWGPGNQLAPQPPSLTSFIMLGSIPLSTYRMFAITAGLLIMGGMWLFIGKTNIGLVVRACLDNKDMVNAFGINSSAVLTLVFGIGSAIAGISGVLGAPIFGLFPDVGGQMLTVCFVVVVMGGLGSIRGAMISGPILGVFVAFAALISMAGIGDVILYVMMAATLLIRPMGLFGDKL